MRRLIREFLRTGFGLEVRSRRNTWFTAITPVEDLNALIRDLHPVQARYPLIRLGPCSDGGYLVPDCLDEIKACFSPGVSEISGFEKDCAERGVPVFLADASVDGPAEDHQLFSFSKKYVGAFSNGTFMSIDSWISSSLPSTSSDIMMQMDIEGFEYEVILSASEPLMRRLRIIVIEFHWLDQLWNLPFFKIASRAIRKLLSTHACVHIHPNNDSPIKQQFGVSIPVTMEFTFVRKELITNYYRYDFPHHLDFDNTRNPHQALPQNWFRVNDKPSIRS
jgi:hypothetical protein